MISSAHSAPLIDFQHFIFIIIQVAMGLWEAELDSTSGHLPRYMRKRNGYSRAGLGAQFEG
jgi:hypothetical protein